MASANSTSSFTAGLMARSIAAVLYNVGFTSASVECIAQLTDLAIKHLSLSAKLTQMTAEHGGRTQPTLHDAFVALGLMGDGEWIGELEDYMTNVGAYGEEVRAVIPNFPVALEKGGVVSLEEGLIDPEREVPTRELYERRHNYRGEIYNEEELERRQFRARTHAQASFTDSTGPVLGFPVVIQPQRSLSSSSTSLLIVGKQVSDDGSTPTIASPNRILQAIKQREGIKLRIKVPPRPSSEVVKFPAKKTDTPSLTPTRERREGIKLRIKLPQPSQTTPSQSVQQPPLGESPKVKLCQQDAIASREEEEDSGSGSGRLRGTKRSSPDEGTVSSIKVPSGSPQPSQVNPSSPIGVDGSTQPEDLAVPVKNRRGRPPKNVISAESGKPSAVKEIRIQSCYAVLRHLMSRKNAALAQPFLDRVDPEFYPDYLTIIERPIDFNFIERKLKRRQYMSSREFYDDVELLFSNCLRYNKPGSEFYEAGRKLRDIFQEVWKQQTR